MLPFLSSYGIHQIHLQVCIYFREAFQKKKENIVGTSRFLLQHQECIPWPTGWCGNASGWQSKSFWSTWNYSSTLTSHTDPSLKVSSLERYTDSVGKGRDRRERQCWQACAWDTQGHTGGHCPLTLGPRTHASLELGFKGLTEVAWRVTFQGLHVPATSQPCTSYSLQRSNPLSVLHQHLGWSSDIMCLQTLGKKTLPLEDAHFSELTQL